MGFLDVDLANPSNIHHLLLIYRNGYHKLLLSFFLCFSNLSPGGAREAEAGVWSEEKQKQKTKMEAGTFWDMGIYKRSVNF